jgi:hypothetical protein
MLPRSLRFTAGVRAARNAGHSGRDDRVGSGETQEDRPEGRPLQGIRQRRIALVGGGLLLVDYGFYV